MDEQEQGGAATDVHDAVEHVEDAVAHVEDTVEDAVQAGADIPAETVSELLAVARETRDAVRELGKHLVGEVHDAEENVADAADDTVAATEEAAVAAPDAVENAGATVEKGLITKLHESLG